MCPKAAQRKPKAFPKTDKTNAMQSLKHAVALQTKFKGDLYTQRLPINCTSGHYVSRGHHSFLRKVLAWPDEMVEYVQGWSDAM